MIEAFSCWPSTAGAPPSWPPATWLFCASTAAITSAGVRLYWFRSSGFSQMRIAYCEPNSWIWPTPCTRLIGSCTLAATKSARSERLMEPSLELNAITIRKESEDLVTCTPCCCTSCGSSGVASCSLFCTCTWAMSGLVPGAKVIAIWALPAESLVEVMYSRLSMPFICCSITWVTESSTTFADAPG